MAVLTKKLKGSTLIEALISMVILMICFGIASMIYINVMETGNERQQLKAQLLLTIAARKAKQDQKYLDEILESEHFMIEKKVSRYRDSPQLFLLHLKAFDTEEKLIAEYKELVMSNQ